MNSFSNSTFQDIIFTDLKTNFQYTATGETDVIVIMGPPCAGKSTLTALLSEKYYMNIIALDAIRGYYPLEMRYTDLANKAVFSTFFRLLEYAVNEKYTCICDGIFYSKVNRTKISDLVKNVPFKFAFVDANLQVLLDRKNRRTETEKDVISEDRLTFFYQSLKRPQNRSLLIDTSNRSIELCFAELEEKLFSREIDFLKEFESR